MPKKNIAASDIPDEEILRYPNVPVPLAAKYIGSSTETIYRALQDERAPFGFATYNPKTGTWTNHISPGLLIKYKRGDLPTYRLGEVQKLIMEGAEELINAKLSGLKAVLDKICQA